MVLVEMVARRRKMVGILLLAWMLGMASPLSAVDLVRVTARRWADPAAAVKVTRMAVSLVEASFIKVTKVATPASPQTRILLAVGEAELGPQDWERRAPPWVVPVVKDLRLTGLVATRPERMPLERTVWLTAAGAERAAPEERLVAPRVGSAGQGTPLLVETASRSLEAGAGAAAQAGQAVRGREAQAGRGS